MPASLNCLYDEVNVAVCSSGTERVSGHDATTGQPLWEIGPGGGRLVPQVRAAWHGAIYAETSNGPLVLDARTGADKETAPGAAPYLVNDRFAVMANPAGAEIYRAIG